MRRVVVDATDHDLGVALNTLLKRSLFIGSCLRLDFFLASECLVAVVLQVVVLQQAADAQTDLSLRPRRQKLCLDLRILGRPILDNRLDQLLLLPRAPVLALLHVEVLDVELAVVVADIAAAEVFSHLDDVLLLLGAHDVVARLPLLLLEEHGRRLGALLRLLQLGLHVGGGPLSQGEVHQSLSLLLNEFCLHGGAL